MMRQFRTWNTTAPYMAHVDSRPVAKHHLDIQQGPGARLNSPVCCQAFPGSIRAEFKVVSGAWTVITNQRITTMKKISIAALMSLGLLIAMPSQGSNGRAMSLTGEVRTVLPKTA